MYANLNFFCGSGKLLRRYPALSMSNTCATVSFSVSTYPRDDASFIYSYLLWQLFLSFLSSTPNRLIETLSPPSSASRPLTGGDDKRVKRQNIQRFLDSCKAYGMPESELFEVEDLLSMQDIPKVTRCFYALGKHVIFAAIYLSAACANQILCILRRQQKNLASLNWVHLTMSGWQRSWVGPQRTQFGAMECPLAMISLCHTSTLAGLRIDWIEAKQRLL